MGKHINKKPILTVSEVWVLFTCFLKKHAVYKSFIINSDRTIIDSASPLKGDRKLRYFFGQRFGQFHGTPSISNSFVFRKTSEGYEFWYKINMLWCDVRSKVEIDRGSSCSVIRYNVIKKILSDGQES